jgi:hypothetical protein
MFRSRLVKRGLVIAASCALLSALMGAIGGASAWALSPSPWWHATSWAVPSVMNPATARDEVQELQVNATGGDVLWLEARTQPFPAVAFPYNASHEEVQTALEELYGAGNVEVTGGPVGKPAIVTELEPYAIRFVGSKGGRPVSLPEDFFGDGGEFGLLPGTPLEGEAKAKQVTAGKAMGEVTVIASNLGTAPASGETEAITLSDVVPPGFEAVGISGGAFQGTAAALPMECSLAGENGVKAPACSFTGSVPSYETLTLNLQVDVAGGSSGALNRADVSGGQARPVSVSMPRLQLGESTPFGVSDYELSNESEGGLAATQAGSHPLQQTTTIVLNQVVSPGGNAEPAALPKDLHFSWPAGLIGNPASLPQCPIARFLSEKNGCPADTAVGVAKPIVNVNKGGGNVEFVAEPVPLFNLAPAPGEPARFAFKVVGIPVYIDPSVRSGRDYGITVNVQNISQLAGFLASEVTVWGVPGAAIHNQFRGEACIGALNKRQSCSAEVENSQAFLSLPTACSGQSLVSKVTGDSWTASVPTESQPVLGEAVMPEIDGCDALPFNPQIIVKPDSEEASKPTGLTVDVHVPQQESLSPTGLAVSDVRDITVTLPEGVAVNPSNADGLLACSEGLVGFEGFGELASEPGVNNALFAPRLPGSIPALNAGEDAPLTPGVNFCPNASKIGEATIKTPLLPPTQPLKGAVYLAAQDANPFGSLIAMYVVAEDPVSGILVRIAGQVHLNSETGQLVTTFENNPQAAFEDAELHFFGGERAPLASPDHCGTYETTASMTPWSGGSPVSTSSSFQITTGPNGAHCPAPGEKLPFSPTLAAGTTSVQAGGFTPLVTTFSRTAGQQNLHQVQLQMPPGLLGLVPSVTPCAEGPANAGTCPASSLIGHTIVSVGVGGDPYTVTGGEVFLTEGYEGSAYGLSIVNPAVAGPFNLGKVIVRAKIEVNPLTAQLTVTTNGSGPYAIPHILDGIPLQIQHINVTIEREHFIFNPTDCEPLTIGGSLEGVEGATSAVSEPFQVTNCAILGFKPKLSVSTSGKVSKENGASLTIKIAYPANAIGKEAWFKETKFDFPKQLPSRLTTLQQACLAAVFEKSPADCPSASQVGTMTVATPVLPGLLHGIVYFVSYGNVKFPEAVIVLKGEGTASGVTVDLHAETFVSKKGVTSATLHAIPGVPFSSVEVKLPTGPFSEFTNNNLHPCGSKEHLTMDSRFASQSGIELKQATPVTITGCPKSHPKKAKKAAKRASKKRS